MWLLVITLLLAMMPPAAAQASKRMALLIGNEAYRFERTLKNPVSDANLLSRVLRDDLKFDEVKLASNLDVNSMDRVIEDFARRSKGADTIVFYYSGHGMKSLDRRNFLLPIDARTGTDDAPELTRQAVSAEDIRDRLKAAGARITLLILDACRDGPGRGRSGSKGLARMGGGNQVLVAYASEEDRIAADGLGANSPYAEALAQAFRRTEMSLLAQLDWVGDEVRRRHPNQEPTREGNLRADAFLVSRDSPGGQVALIPPTNTTSVYTNPQRMGVTLPFLAGDWTVLPAAETKLDEFLRQVRDLRGNAIRVVGHASADEGDEAKLMGLSRSRADAVRTLLVVRYNLSVEVVTSEGQGAAQPVATEGHFQAQRANRRVELEIISGR